jgi:hypothetical protein
MIVYSYRMTVNLSDREIAELDKQNPATANNGGFQNFLIRLRRQCDSATGELALSVSDLERIPRYAFGYGNGGWENRLKNIFGRTLGSNLGR